MSEFVNGLILQGRYAMCLQPNEVPLHFWDSSTYFFLLSSRPWYALSFWFTNNWESPCMRRRWILIDLVRWRPGKKTSYSAILLVALKSRWVALQCLSFWTYQDDSSSGTIEAFRSVEAHGPVGAQDFLLPRLFIYGG